MSKTTIEFTNIITNCRSIYIAKTKDYGTAWRILRTTSLTDQLFIKANRIKTIQETGVNQVGESIEGEFKAIVNYCVIALIQLKETEIVELELELNQATNNGGSEYHS